MAKQITAAELEKYLLPYYFTHDYRLERARLESFVNWPLLQYDISDFATKGFYQYNYGEIKCYGCDVRYDLLEQKKPPEFVLEHKQNCRFVNGQIENFEAARAISSIDEIYSLQDMRFARARKHSFVMNNERDVWPWPERIDEMVKAGLYYTGKLDVVRCFCCRLALWQWLPTDRAKDEHRRWAKNHECNYDRLSIDDEDLHPKDLPPHQLPSIYDECGPGRFHPRITHVPACSLTDHDEPSSSYALVRIVDLPSDCNEM